MAKNAMSRQIADADDPLNTLATPSVSTGVGRVPTREIPIQWAYRGCQIATPITVYNLSLSISYVD